MAYEKNLAYVTQINQKFMIFNNNKLEFLF